MAEPARGGPLRELVLAKLGAQHLSSLQMCQQMCRRSHFAAMYRGTNNERKTAAHRANVRYSSLRRKGEGKRLRLQVSRHSSQYRHEVVFTSRIVTFFATMRYRPLASGLSMASTCATATCSKERHNQNSAARTHPHTIKGQNVRNDVCGMWGLRGLSSCRKYT